MVHLRPVMAALAAALVSGCALQFEASGDYEETFDPGAAATLELAGLEGDVNLRGQAADSIKIRGTRVAVGATREAARDNLERARLQRVPGEGAGALRLEFAPRVEYIGLIDLELDRVSTIPAGMGVSIEVEEGDLQIDGVLGDLDLITDRGDIEVLGGEGDVSADADSGTVWVQSSGWIDAVSAGHLRVDALGINESEVSAETTGSTIELGISPQDFEVICRTSGGEVDVDEALDTTVVEGADGAVVVTSGTGARKITLRSRGANVTIEALSE